MAGAQTSALLILGQAAASIQAVVDQIRRLPDAVRGFVDAFSPQTGERLDYAFRSLYATVGYALEPVLTTATRIVEMFANAISGGMNRLREPVAAVGAMLSAVLEPALAAAGTAFDVLVEEAALFVPLLRPLGAVLEGVAVQSRLVVAYLGELSLALIEGAIAPLGELKLATQFLAATFVDTTIAMVAFADTLLRMAGLGAVADKALARLAQDVTGQGRRPGAPEGFQSGGLEDVYRRRLLEAARGGGKSAEERTFDIWERIHQAIKRLVEINENKETREAKEAGVEAGLRVGAAAAGPGVDPLVTLLRQEGRNGLREAARQEGFAAALAALGW